MCRTNANRSPSRCSGSEAANSPHHPAFPERSSEAIRQLLARQAYGKVVVVPEESPSDVEEALSNAYPGAGIRQYIVIVTIDNQLRRNAMCGR
jgi:hypothetical protein